MISPVEWAARNHRKYFDFHVFFIIASVEWEAWEVPNHRKYKDFHLFFMISLVKWEAWEAHNHLKCIDFHTFSQFLWRGGKRESP